MTGVLDRELRSLGPFQVGVANVPAETDLPTKNGVQVALREAVNVDIPSSGAVQRREGYSLALAGTSAHSGWHDGMFPFALYVDQGTLRAMQTGGSTWPLVSGLHDAEVSYALVNERAYWSNGAQTGIVTAGGDALPWGVEHPNGQPLVSVSAAGGLAAGLYQVAVTFRDIRGEESGTGQAAQIAVPEGGGIALSNVPQPLDADVNIVRVYLSPANGDMLYFVRDMPVGMTSATLGAGARGKPLDSQFMEKMPAGNIVRALNGRMFVARGAEMLWSEALGFGLHHPTKNRLRVGAKITLMEPVADGTDAAGLFVADEKRTYFFSGSDPAQFAKRICYSYPAIPGTGQRVPSNVFGIESTAPAVYWIATNGVACLGLPGGQVVPLAEHIAVAPNAPKGASLFRETRGMSQVVTALRESTQRTGMTDAAVARVYRNGVEIT